MATRGDIDIPRYDGDPTLLQDFLEDLETYFVATNLSITTNSEQCAAVLACQAGRKIRELLKINRPLIVKEDNETDYNFAKRIILEKELPKKNPTFEGYQFRKIFQREEEPFQEFVLRLETQIQRCEFTDRERQLRDQIVIGCLSSNLRKVALRENPNVAKLLELGKSEEHAVESSEAMQKSVKDEPETSYQTRFVKNRQYSNTRFQKSPRERLCYNCGMKWPHPDRDCPAKGKICANCQKPNHFAKVCHSPAAKAMQLSAEDEASEHAAATIDDNEYLFHVNKETFAEKILKGAVDIMFDSNIPVKFLPDTGASVTIMDYETFLRLKQVKHYPLIRVEKTKIYSYGSVKPLDLKGMFYAKVSYNGKEAIVRVFVLQKFKCGNLFCKDDCIKLGLLKFTVECANSTISNENITHIHQSTSSLSTETQTILKNFPDGIGELKNFELKLQIDGSKHPVTQKCRMIPLSRRKFVEDKIQELLQNDIIEEVTDVGTTWLSPIHVVEREGKLRMTIDMRMANQAIMRVRKPIPTVEEVLTELNGSIYFSKIDLNSAYFQIPLHSDSRDITTFATHTGIYRFKRLFFGVTSACEEFQSIITRLLSSIIGCRNIADDIIVFGKTEEEHDKALEATLRKLQESGLTVNKDKCKLKQPAVEFFGYSVSQKGITPLIKDSLHHIQRPEDRSEVRSYVGTVNFISKFIPDFSSILAPISNLLSKNIDFHWNSEQENAFQQILREIRKPRVLKHFDPKEPTELTTDASPVGLCAVLSQNGVPVTFVSRKLTEVEQRYSQTEKEALAIVWGCERLHFYLYGVQFKIKSDHKPLTVLYSPSGKPSARIMRWALRLLPYSFTIEHIPGISNPADYFSRKPVDEPSAADNSKSFETEGHVNSVITSTIPGAISLQEVLGESLKDAELQELILRIKDRKWNLSPQLKPFGNIKDELTTKSGLVLRGSQLVMPQSLRKRSIELAHSSHLGLSKTKQYIRSKVWWPGIDSSITQLIRNCGICQSVNPDGKERLEPLRIKAAPTKPFSTVHIDLFGPLRNGTTILGIIDEFSRWPECYILTSTQTKYVINALDKTFARFGTPDTIVSDNGPQFISWEFKNFMAANGIKGHLVTPYYPQANSSIERFFRTLKKFTKVCNISRTNLADQLHDFLSMYRNTPVRATGHTPAEMILRYCPNGKLPQVGITSDRYSQDLFSKAQNSDMEYKLKAKANSDAYQRRTVESCLIQGDMVLIKNKEKRKEAPVYDPEPFIVTGRRGNRVYLERHGKQLCRPLDHCKQIPNRKIGTNKAVHDSLWYHHDQPDACVPNAVNQEQPAILPEVAVNRGAVGAAPQQLVPNLQLFRENVFRGSAPPGAITPPPQLQVTGSGRQVKPVVGTRLYVD